jgi:hypothetical protein
MLGADVCIMLGAIPRGPGMERKDLLEKNAGIFKQQGGCFYYCIAVDVIDSMHKAVFLTLLEAPTPRCYIYSHLCHNPVAPYVIMTPGSRCRQPRQHQLSHHGRWLPSPAQEELLRPHAPGPQQVNDL